MTVYALCDAVGSFAAFAAAFPSADAGLIQRGRRAYPQLWRDDDWWLPFRAFLFRFPDGHCVLVDAGVGPPPGAFLPDRQGWLPDQLQAAGVEPADVDMVLFTHLHVDHIGWAGVEGVATFANARYLVPELDWTFFTAAAPGLIEEKFGGVRRDRLELYSAPRDEGRLALVPTPGHTPGHTSVSLEHAGERLLVLADVAVHPLQLDEPMLAYESDVDEELAASTRAAVVAELRTSDVIVAAGHFPAAFGEVTSGGAAAWRDLSATSHAGNLRY